MEVSLSKKSLTNVIGLVLLAAVLFGGYTVWKRGWFERWLIGRETPQTSPEAEPAIQALAALYAPSGERVQWEEQVCRGMTVEGCQLFRTLYANPIWDSTQTGTASVTFIEVAEILDDASQIWKTEVTKGGTILPVYIHVTQNEAGRWLMKRVLFAQETTKYEDQ